jgi:hypothetical protein
MHHLTTRGGQSDIRWNERESYDMKPKKTQAAAPPKRGRSADAEKRPQKKYPG